MTSLNQTLIHHFLESSAWVHPDKTALIHEGDRAGYAQINRCANQLAHWLIGRGIQKGDRVVLILDNGLQYAISYYGSLKAGAVVAPLSTGLTPAGLGPLLTELEPKVIISSARFERLLKAVDIASPGLAALVLRLPKLGSWLPGTVSLVSWEDIMTGTNRQNPELAMPGTALANIIYTSGSTGKAKGVMLSHQNIVSNTQSIGQYLPLTTNDIHMVVLPFFYVMGMSLLNTHFSEGACLVINNKFAFPAGVLKQMVEEQVTGFSGVPSTYAYLLHRSPLRSYRDKLAALQYFAQAGGHMTAKIKEKLRDTLPLHTKIYIMYGATEAAARLAYLEPERFADKMNSIGKAIPGVTLKVLDPEGRELSARSPGELVAAGDNIMQGYWRDPAATAAVLDQNGYRTGDMAFKDEEGFFFLVGRKDNLIKVGGHRINPQEIEDAIMDTDLAVETAVVGVPDDLLGTRIIAVLVSKEKECTTNQILSLCAERLPKYKIPSAICFLGSLPKHPNGKIDGKKCRELILKKF